MGTFDRFLKRSNEFFLKCPVYFSRLNKNRIADEMEADPARRLAVVEMDGDRLSQLLLKIPQVLSLSGDSSGVAGGVPGGYQPTALFIPCDLKREFIHHH